MPVPRPIPTVTPSGCWEREQAYPDVKIAGKTRKLARVVLEQANGGQRFLPETVIRHKCDNPRCVNPKHLVAGTHADNVADRVRAGRSAVGPKNGRSKLTEEQALQAFTSTGSAEVLAREWGVDAKVIRDIRAGVTWRYLTAAEGVSA